jgi:formylglycine-generating enzyme required for sulfatase activity
MTMIYVPAGSFTMGSDESELNQRPAHEISLDAFWIDRTEVTNTQFMEFVAVTGYETTAEKLGFSNVTVPSTWVSTDGADWQHPQGPGSDLEDLEGHPVFHISWVDADAYCSWVGARLPTEAEWEYAARGPESLKYPWGDDFDGEKANWCDASCRMRWADGVANDGYSFVAPAGNYPAGASWVGALDMAGNLWEWVKDWYESDYYAEAPEHNPQGPESGELKLLRGGGFDNQANQLRGAYRLGGDSPENSYDGYGFRCVVTPSE